MFRKVKPYQEDLSQYEKRLRQNHKDPEFNAVMEMIRRVKLEHEMLMDVNEGSHVYQLVRSVNKIQGDFAEVGVYKGGSARIICEAKEAGRALHLFDTFDGLPMPSEKDDKEKFSQGRFSAQYNEILWEKFPNVYGYKGVFPETAKPIEDRKFAFVHLDVDLYESTLNALGFFYPRMSTGGMILIHDCYKGCGAKTAVDSFFSMKPEYTIQISFRQGLVVKI